MTWNRYMEDFTHKTKQEVLGKNGFALFPFVREMGAADFVKRALAGEYFSGLNFPFRIPESGRLGWFSAWTGPLRDADGHIIGTLSTVRDITKRKQTDAALRESNEFSRQILEHTSEGIVVCDREFKTLLWNPFMEQMSGLTADQVRGKSLLDLFPSMRKQGFDGFCERALLGETCSTHDIAYEVPGAKKAGWVVASFGPLRNSEKKIIGIFANVREISERRERENELRRLSASLLQLQDRERRRIARDLHDSLGQSVLAVNLNLAVLDRVSAVLDEPTNRALRETREIMDHFVSEIRSLAYVLHSPVLDELGLGSAIEEFGTGFGERSGVHVEVEIGQQIGRLPQEIEMALFRIVQECLANIQRHSGSPTARIRLNRDDHQLTIEVADQGRWKSRNVDTQPQPGSERLGVGILGMRERVRELGGTLEIKSGPEGTTVSAALPLQEETLHGNADPDC